MYEVYYSYNIMCVQFECFKEMIIITFLEFIYITNIVSSSRFVVSLCFKLVYTYLNESYFDSV